MMIDEFRKRTQKFLTEDEIANYNMLFEPAYMAATDVDKDEFCDMLKDETIRKFVVCMSQELTRRSDVERNIRNEVKEAQIARDEAQELSWRLIKSLKVCAATIDRELSR